MSHPRDTIVAIKQAINRYLGTISARMFQREPNYFTLIKAEFLILTDLFTNIYMLHVKFFYAYSQYYAGNYHRI